MLCSITMHELVFRCVLRYLTGPTAWKVMFCKIWALCEFKISGNFSISQLPKSGTMVRTAVLEDTPSGFDLWQHPDWCCLSRCNSRNYGNVVEGAAKKDFLKTENFKSWHRTYYNEYFSVFICWMWGWLVCLWRSSSWYWFAV